jgi:predicted ATP-grasp superfamily ATP-dependent carboligase
LQSIKQCNPGGIVKIFICEHACIALPTGGNALAPAGFRGDMLLEALLADISHVGDLAVSILRAPDCSAIHAPRSTSVVPMHDDALTSVTACIRNADAVWPLAPESNGMLESISKTVIQHNKILLGSTPDAVHLAGSKYRTSQALRAAGIPVVPTFRAQANLPADPHAWVVKPDDGAGCSDTHIFSHRQAAQEWIGARSSADYVLQPYISGRPCNLSLLCGNEDVFLLGCNDQRVAVSDNQFHYMGTTVNSIDDRDGALMRLARRVIAAIPGLWGYVGIDLIITDQGPVVLEVNPRMTMSHAGLHASIGANPAAMLFDMLRSGHCGMPASGKNRQVSVDVDDRQPRTHDSSLSVH